MRAYQAKIGNEMNWVSSGALSFAVLILADDFISAAMRAQEICSAAQERVAAIPGVEVKTINVTSLDQVSTDVIGDVGSTRYEQTLEQAIEKLLYRAAKEHTQS